MSYTSGSSEQGSIGIYWEWFVSLIDAKKLFSELYPDSRPKNKTPFLQAIKQSSIDTWILLKACHKIQKKAIIYLKNKLQ